MPNRIIKESICTSDSVDGLSWFEECFFYRLIVNCDDFGRMDARPSVLKARLFPLKERVTAKDCSVALLKLLDIGVAHTYVSEGKPYLYLAGWESHQSIRAKKSKYPDPKECECNHMNADEINCMQMHANVPVIQSNPNPNPNPNTDSCADKPRKAARFVPPSLEEVQAYCRERKNNVDAEHFLDFYASKGWKVGSQPMKDWKACVRTWEKNGFSSGRAANKPDSIHGNRKTDSDEMAAVRALMEE